MNTKFKQHEKMACLWLDMEMNEITNIHENKILEVAVIATSLDLVTVLGAFSSLVFWEEAKNADTVEKLEKSLMFCGWSKRENAKNNLTKDLLSLHNHGDGPTLAQVDEALQKWLIDLRNIYGISSPLQVGGYSVHSDFWFARIHLPKFAQFLDHRLLDLTPMISLVCGWWNHKVDTGDWFQQQQKIQTEISCAPLFLKRCHHFPQQSNCEVCFLMLKPHRAMHDAVVGLCQARLIRAHGNALGNNNKKKSRRPRLVSPQIRTMIPQW